MVAGREGGWLWRWGIWRQWTVVHTQDITLCSTATQHEAYAFVITFLPATCAHIFCYTVVVKVSIIFDVLLS